LLVGLVPKFLGSPAALDRFVRSFDFGEKRFLSGSERLLYPGRLLLDLPLCIRGSSSLLRICRVSFGNYFFDLVRFVLVRHGSAPIPNGYQ
jgi:hypothetical protein